LRSSAGYDTMERELWQGRNKEWEEEKRVAAGQKGAMLVSPLLCYKSMNVVGTFLSIVARPLTRVDP
jgi:hypothetical protein